MTQTRHDWTVIASVSTVHFVSHIHILALAPLFPLLQKEFGCGYTALGLIVIGYNLVTALLQTPMGRITDRFGGRALLVLAQIGAALAFLAASMAQSLTGLAICVTLAGIANAVYHPADMALLSRHVSHTRRAQAFATHSLAGIAGFAAAPLLIGAWGLIAGWRAGLMLTATLSCLGLIALLVLNTLPLGKHIPNDTGFSRRVPAWKIPVFRRQFGLFAAFGAISAASQGFMIPALLAYSGMKVGAATTFLSAYLLAITLGVALGGMTARRLLPARSLMFGMGGSALCWALASLTLLPQPLLFALICVAGLANGLALPSRDTLLAGLAEGPDQAAIFGFVTAGLGVGQVIAPLVAGPLVDQGLGVALFPLLAALSLACLLGREAAPSSETAGHSLPR
ncbi:MFS transporter (plasmid) [Thioclava sp. 'Guangxiensis']|uniref:MFS transporter n=1 Tax=Thioclava sp. 'Guangxiensis' TaxID=3149044 RepID=UPI0032C44521